MEPGYLSGLRWGLNYATGGTGKVNGYKIEFRSSRRDRCSGRLSRRRRTPSARGKIIAGTALSGAVLQLAPLAEQNKILYISGPAATDALTGVNDYTFRSGRQIYQDVKAPI